MQAPICKNNQLTCGEGGRIKAIIIMNGAIMTTKSICYRQDDHN